MKGVIGLLLILLGAELAYLVLAGKFPLQLKKASETAPGGGTGGGADSADPRASVFYGMPRYGTYVGKPLAQFGGLLN